MRVYKVKGVYKVKRMPRTLMRRYYYLNFLNFLSFLNFLNLFN